jgi:aerobic carbon-monoxide dehydrogenase small subunit
VKEVAFSLNGRPVRQQLSDEQLLLDVLREQLGFTSVKRSCEVQVCGTCTVLVDGIPLSSCCTLAVEAAGSEVTTVEGLADRPYYERLEQAFLRHAAVQCGFCTPAMLLTISALWDSGELDDEQGIVDALAGNLCRCTGYRSIIDAVLDARGMVGA